MQVDILGEPPYATHPGMNPASHLPLLLACRMPRRGRLPSIVLPVGASVLGVEVLVDLAGDADVRLLGSGKNGWFFEGGWESLLLIQTDACKKMCMILYELCLL